MCIRDSPWRYRREEGQKRHTPVGGLAMSSFVIQPEIDWMPANPWGFVIGTATPVRQLTKNKTPIHIGCYISKGFSY